MANEKRSSARRWLMLAVKLLIVVAVIWAIHRTISDVWHKLSEHPEQLWAIRPGWLLVSGLLYLVGILPEGLFWHRALVSLGQQAPWVGPCGPTTLDTWESTCPARPWLWSCGPGWSAVPEWT